MSISTVDTSTPYSNATWIPPKVNWTVDDYFNAIDYNRIIGNLNYLKYLSDQLFETVNIISMGEEKTYLSFIYAKDINAIEYNLEIININTYVLNIGEKTLYKDNGKTPLYTEFNRIEGAMLKLYTMMQAHKNALPKLAFTLNGQKGFKV